MKTKVGLVGCGNISDIYIENARRFANYEIVACADAVPGRAREKAERHAIPRATRLEEMLHDPEVEIVLNLTNPQSHASVDLAALESGKHVYSEKPFATSLEEGQRIRELAASRQLTVGCAPDTFLGGRLQTLRALLDEGAIGEPVAAFASMVCHGHESWHPGPEFYYKAGAGPLFDMGPYYLTALVSLLGPARRVSGVARASFPRRTIGSAPLKGHTIEVEVPTHVSGSIEFDCGTIVTLVLSFDVWDSTLPRLEIWGAAGALAIEDADPLAGPNVFGGFTHLRRPQEADWNGFPAALPRKERASPWRAIPPRFPYNENARGVGLADMVEAICSGRRPRADATMALHVLEIIEGLLRSAERGMAYVLTSTCERPLPLAADVREFTFNS